MFASYQVKGNGFFPNVNQVTPVLEKSINGVALGGYEFFFEMGVTDRPLPLRCQSKVCFPGYEVSVRVEAFCFALYPLLLKFQPVFSDPNAPYI
jgi:hypothetical protein